MTGWPAALVACTLAVLVLGPLIAFWCWALKRYWQV